MNKKKLPSQIPPAGHSVSNTTKLSSNKQYCCLNFRYFKTNCISEKNFNNFFRDSTHFQSVMSSFMGTVLPKISDLTTTELLAGGRFTQQFHFHKIGTDKFEKLRSILEAYSFNETLINQFLDGENIFQFAGNLEGHLVESRVVCEYLEGVLYILFFDTNHHLYFDKSKVGESLSYNHCPYETGNECYNAYNCLAREFLDLKKINETYSFSYANDNK